ncbi:amidohydrolase [Rhizobium sp. 1AS11]|uniref:amidohydrolase n=1 Tax=Rhizobium acaciae TaxID=2989736 RepID=UPI0022220D9B|nr:amidohydrolase [Rhizobium acaciae]MCW1410670.1 amidohydrolase [Rhizobium acaciae]MCW1743029.1 amidohydrolase [Rhizobium acaciae]
MRNDRLSLEEIARQIHTKALDFCALSDRIWDMPELAFEEHRSVAEQCAALEREGFRIKKNAGGIPTAFVAEYGRGGPVIGVLGEYDALPALSQISGALKQEPTARGASGHGCGHNLLGAGSALAAAALKEALVSEGIPGTVRYYGCPAEENGGGKTYMARAGLFNDLDIALCWHPHIINEVHATSSLAEIQVYFRFHGRATHAAYSPHMGRSALDAIELMNVGVNYMREHMPTDARVHYAITNTGGDAPNTVQAYAESLYSIRSPVLPDAQRLFARVKKIAEGAALMTETSVVVQIAGGSSNIVPNKVLQELMYENMCRIGPPAFDEADYAFAKKLRETSMTEESLLTSISPRDPSLRSKIFHDGVLGLPGREEVEMGTTDVGDASWIVPTVQCHTACFAIGTEFHSWQMVTQAKLPAAHKGMILAAQTIAATAIDCLRNPAIIARAKNELNERLGSHSYVCPIPPDVTPDDLRKKPA